MLGYSMVSLEPKCSKSFHNDHISLKNFHAESWEVMKGGSHHLFMTSELSYE